MENAKGRLLAFTKEWKRRSKAGAMIGNTIYELGLSDGVLELTVSDIDAVCRAQAEAKDAWREALERIACFNDTSASQHLDRTGSYGYFDEPGSVQIARESLAAAPANDNEKVV